MTSFYKILIILSLLTLGCKSDNNSSKVEKSETPTVEELADSQKMLNNIENAHNASKFKSKAQVKFKLKLNIENTLFFDGYVTLKTDGSQAKFLDSNIDKTLEASILETDLDKKLYMIAELYSMGFWFDSENFKLISKNDSLNISGYHSERLNSDYKIYSHPLTHVIQKINFNTTIYEKPFDKGSLIYDKYITVNRVPVALKWNINLDEEQTASAEISRISYPETF